MRGGAESIERSPKNNKNAIHRQAKITINNFNNSQGGIRSLSKAAATERKKVPIKTKEMRNFN
jgi:hypothetical protein